MSLSGRVGSFFNNHKNTMLVSSAAGLKVVVDNSWVWSDTPMGTEGQSDAGKYVWNVVLILLTMGAWGIGGAAADIATRQAAQKADALTFWGRHKAKLTGGFLGASFAMINNYWLLTPMPMPSGALPSGVKKALEYIAETLASATMTAELGNIVDLLWKIDRGDKVDDDYQVMPEVDVRQNGLGM